MSQSYILTLSCPDTPGIVYHVSDFLYKCGGNILDSQQFGDQAAGLFFMRVFFSVPDAYEHKQLRDGFKPIAERFSMHWGVYDSQQRARVLIMVSKFGHCLNDLLFRANSDQLSIDVPAVVSNHMDFADLTRSYGVPYHYLPLDPASRPQQEQAVLDLIESQRIDLVVLARYMQVLSPSLSLALTGRAINIHHGFLPSFKGARPYHQAHQRGVKLIGATAHYITNELDEGPIIEQDIARVDHTMTPDQLASVGRDIESSVLARAIRSHVERRILLQGNKTVIFR